MGQKVGEYVVEKKIGEGGFGTVFLAQHPVIGKQVAIKVLNRQFSADPEMVSRFVAEARAVNQIRHRNIIDIFAFGRLDDGRHYYVMEYLDGMPLDEYLDERDQLTLGEAIPILRAIARALDAAHGKGIAHRDLKPENIFLAIDSDGGMFPKLLDFGIAKLLTKAETQSHKTRTGAPIGTPYYMSPEQCRGRDVDHRTDIYAFGIVTFRMLTGDIPFDGEDYMEILLQQIGEDAAPPSSIVPELTESVDQGVAWMLRKDPAERPPNLVTAVRALEDAAASAGIPVPAGPAPSGVYAASTSTLSSQRTPSVVTPLPQALQNDSGIGMAATMQPRGGEAPTGDESKKSKAPALLGLAVIGAIALGVVAYMVVSKTKTSDTKPLAAKVPAPAAVFPDAAAPVAKAAPVADAAPAQSSLVTITIKGPPAGTEVYGPRGLLGIAPGDIQLERGTGRVVLSLKADGYRSTTTKVVPSSDRSIKVRLKRKPGARRVSRPRGGRDGKDGKAGKDGKEKRNTIEDPFGNK